VKPDIGAGFHTEDDGICREKRTTKRTTASAPQFLSDPRTRTLSRHGLASTTSGIEPSGAPSHRQYLQAIRVRGDSIVVAPTLPLIGPVRAERYDLSDAKRLRVGESVDVSGWVDSLLGLRRATCSRSLRCLAGGPGLALVTKWRSML
jgi:hypothetical protein